MSGYDKFFKTAKNAKSGEPKANKVPPKKNSTSRAEELSAEEYLRTALKVKSKSSNVKKSVLPIRALVVTVLGLGLAGMGLLYPTEAETLYNRVEFMAFSAADAASPVDVPAQNSQTNKPNSAGNSSSVQGIGAKECEDARGFSEEELSHFNKLNERKKELDLRDAELTTLEEELHKQRKEVEARIAKLEQIRDEVANVLKDRVEVDQQRVSTLVDFYSNMKPKHAAEIFTSLNEDLAVEVLGKMKKKSAADIMNLLDPTKARALSEKFTGYKRR